MEALGQREIILGIDPGSVKTGFGLVAYSQSGVSHVAHGTIVLDTKKNITARLADLAHDLQSIISKYRPTLGGVEDIFLYNNPRSALVLGQARGAALAVLGLNSIAVENFTPTQVKSLVSGNGRAKKFQIAQMVAINLRIDVPNSIDASDALSVALALALSRTAARLTHSE